MKKKICLISLGLILWGCDSKTFVEAGFPGPSNEFTRSTIYNSGVASCKLNTNTASKETCIEKITTLDATDCGYDDLYKFCEATWTANLAATQAAFVSDCQLIIPTKHSTFYFEGGEYLPFDNGTCADINSNKLLYTGRYAVTSVNGVAVGFPYQGVFVNKARTISVNILNYSSVAYPDDYEKKLRSLLNRLLKNERWAF